MNDDQPPEFICFDHAACYFDETRAVAPDALATFADMILNHITNKNNSIILEIGVGTGRVSRAFFPKAG
ncbi:MAG: hypothetical protein ACFFCQ_09970, partial [Promethearchaeota archaeon]